MERRDYAQGTYLTVRYPFATFVGGSALCKDGKVRTLKRISESADTFFSVPASVEVRQNGKRFTVAGYVSVDTVSGSSVETEDDPAIVRFHAYRYGKNGDKV